MLFLYTMECCSVMVVVGGLVAKLCPTLSTMDCSLPGFSIHGISQARVLEWVAISFSSRSFPPRDQTHISFISCTADTFFITEPHREIPYMHSTSCKMPGWMKHKLESRLLGEISITSDMQMISPLWQNVKKN